MLEIIKVVTPVIGLLTTLGVVAWAKGWWLTKWRIHRAPPSDGTHFTILVAQLADDDEKNSQQRHIRQSLEAQFRGVGAATRMHVDIYPEALRLKAGEIGAAVLEAEKKGREWLQLRNADILIWGEVAEAKKLRLRFTTAEGETGVAKPYSLTEDLELPANFGADFGTVLATLAATGIQPVYDKSGQTLAQIIEPVVGKLRPLAANPPASFSDDAKARLWQAYAVGEKQIGEERGDNARLMTAIGFFGKVLTLWTRERLPLNWAVTQNNLGNALLALGQRERGSERLEQAVAAYREALKEHTHERVPRHWATTQNNLGSALAILGERESGTERLEQGVAAYHEALKERTRERVPLAWAMTQNNLGNALLALGQRERDTERLEQAIAAYREALKERIRERIPLDWATTQNNLGSALTILGERESGTERLQQAVAAYREALKEWTRERVPLDWAMTQNNLGNALLALGQRKSDTERLEQAIAAYREALKEWTRERIPLDWATTQNNLGNALRALGERESGTERLERAVAAYREALKEWTRERAPLDWAGAQNNLGNALRVLALREAERNKALAHQALAEAREAMIGSCDVYREAKASYYIEMAERNRARIDAEIARLSTNAPAA